MLHVLNTDMFFDITSQKELSGHVFELQHKA